MIHQSDNCKQLCKKKRQHTPLSFVFKIQYPLARVGTATVPPKHTQIHTKLLRDPDSCWVVMLASTPAPTGQGNPGHLCPFFKNLLESSDLSGGECLYWMLQLVSAVILALQQQQPVLPIPFVNVSCCVHTVAATLYQTKDTELGKSNLEINYHGNKSLLWSDQFAVSFTLSHVGPSDLSQQATQWHCWCTSTFIFSHKK